MLTMVASYIINIISNYNVCVSWLTRSISSVPGCPNQEPSHWKSPDERERSRKAHNIRTPLEKGVATFAKSKVDRSPLLLDVPTFPFLASVDKSMVSISPDPMRTLSFRVEDIAFRIAVVLAKGFRLCIRSGNHWIPGTTVPLYFEKVGSKYAARKQPTVKCFWYFSEVQLNILLRIFVAFYSLLNSF